MSENENKQSRHEITDSQADLVRDILGNLFPGVGVHEENLVEASIALQIASNLCLKASELHHGRTQDQGLARLLLRSHPHFPLGAKPLCSAS